MLQYAIEEKTGNFVHVNTVPNGNQSGCICPECEDSLTAKNNCKEISNHFAHQNLVEGRACLMTQLHLAAQNYFLKLNRFTLPKVTVLFDGTRLTSPEKIININNSKLEARFGKYYADVLLETDVGQIVIEISVTHDSEDKKILYYQDKSIPSLEYDLSKLKNFEVQPSIELLSKNQVPFDWHFAWCQKQLIDEYLEGKRQKELADLKRQKVSAKKSARKFINSKTVLLPTINEVMKHTVGEIDFKEEVQVFAKKNFAVDEITIHSEGEEHLILRCKKLTQASTHTLFIAYPYTATIPQEILKLEGSVIIRQPSLSKGEGALWYWEKYPQMEHRRLKSITSFKNRCEERAKRQKSTEIAEPQILQLSKEYTNNQDIYFKTGYGDWKKWLIKKGLFTPGPNKKNPSYPHLLKYHRKHPSLWMFDEWYVLVITALAEIVDKIPLHTIIVTIDIFYQLALQFGVKKEFSILERMISSQFLKSDSASLIIRNDVISSVLDMFELEMKINRNSKGYIRTGSLLESIKPI
jgi:hypothetical protein